MGIFKRKLSMVVISRLHDTENEGWPKNGNVYYWVRSDIGQICKSKWNEKVPYHEFRLSIGNVFRTRTEARKAIVKQQAHFRSFGREK